MVARTKDADSACMKPNTTVRVACVTVEESAGVVIDATGSVLNVTVFSVDYGDAPAPSDPPDVAEPHVLTLTVTDTLPA